MNASKIYAYSLFSFASIPIIAPTTIRRMYSLVDSLNKVHYSPPTRNDYGDLLLGAIAGPGLAFSTMLLAQYDSEMTNFIASTNLASLLYEAGRDLTKGFARYSRRQSQSKV